MDVNTTLTELIQHLDKRLAQGDYKDAVHKIKLMTTRDMILEMMSK